MNPAGDSNVFDELSHLESTIYMRNQLLRDSDVFGMANSIEIRVPFLENEFVEVAKEEIDSYFATSNMFEKIFIPQNMKFKSTTSIKSEKVFNNIEILRDAAYA